MAKRVRKTAKKKEAGKKAAGARVSNGTRVVWKKTEDEKPNVNEPVLGYWHSIHLGPSVVVYNGSIWIGEDNFSRWPPSVWAILPRPKLIMD